MRFHLLTAAFVASAIAVPLAEPEAAAPPGYGGKTVTVTVGPGATTTKASSTVTVDAIPTSKTSSSTKKTTTSTTSKKTTTSTTSKKTTSSTKKSSTSTKKSSTTSAKSTTLASPVMATTKKTTSTSKKTTSTSTKATSTSKKTTTTSSKASTATAVPTGTLEQIAIYHHNIHRSNHSASNVAWSANLASIAAEIAATCNYQHNTTAGGGGYGQNIAAGVKADNISSVITELFYNGEMPYYNGLYGQSQPSYDNFVHWGHFSQVVWKDTKTIGCAVQYCPDGLANAGGSILPYFTVCNYEPAGNYGGEYADNIGSPLGRAVAHWNTGID